MLNRTDRKEELKTLIFNSNKKISSLKGETKKYIGKLMDLEGKNQKNQEDQS